MDEEARRGLFACRRRTTPSASASSGTATSCCGILGELKAEGERIVGYGASARGNTLLNYYGIGAETLDYIVDRNPLKQGLYSPGMHIPVEGPERLARDDPRLRPPDRLELRGRDRDASRATTSAEAAASSFRFPEPKLVG